LQQKKKKKSNTHTTNTLPSNKRKHQNPPQRTYNPGKKHCYLQQHSKEREKYLKKTPRWEETPLQSQQATTKTQTPEKKKEGEALSEHNSNKPGSLIMIKD
jgi:hypothetical protein